MTDFNTATALWSLDEYIKARKDEIPSYYKKTYNQKIMSDQGTRQSAHLKSYKDTELSHDEDDDSEFNFLTAEKSIDVDAAAHAANMNQLNFEKNDFDQLMYNDPAESNDMDSRTEQFAAPSSTPPRPSVKSRLGTRPCASGGNRGQQQGPQQKHKGSGSGSGSVQKRGKGYANNMNKRNRANNNQNRVSTNFLRGLDVSVQASNQLQMRNLNNANDNFYNANLGPNGATCNSNNLLFNSNNSMMLSNHTITSNSNSYVGMLQNNAGLVNANNYGVMPQNNQCGMANSNNYGGMLQTNQGPGNTNSYGVMLENQQCLAIANNHGGLLQNNQGPGNLNGYGGLFQNNHGSAISARLGEMFPNNQGMVNPNGYGGLLQNNHGSAISAKLGEMFPNNQGNSNSYGRLLQNNQDIGSSSSFNGVVQNNDQRNVNSNLGLLSNNNGSGNPNCFGGMLQYNQGTAISSSYSAMHSNNPNITRPNINANNWNSSAEMQSNTPININSRQNPQEPSVEGKLESILGSSTKPKDDMTVGEALGMSLKDCKSANIQKVVHNLLYLLAAEENDRQNKPNYGVHNKNVSQQRDL